VVLRFGKKKNLNNEIRGGEPQDRFSRLKKLKKGDLEDNAERPGYMAREEEKARKKGGGKVANSFF